MIPHLWKEWRDHRAVILGTLALLPPVLFAAMLLLPEGIVALPTAGAAAGLAIAALALGADLVPGEVRRGTIMFLRRLPDGLGTVFTAKAIVLVAALALTTALGFGVGSLAQNVAGRPAPALDWTYAPEAIAAALWIFAVAMWLPRGELALPATALCLGAFVLPMHLVLAWNPGLSVPAAAMNVGRWVLIPGALLVAWASFRGRRFGGAWGSTWRGLLVTLLLFSPAWGYVARRASDWRYFDLSDQACEVNWAFQGAGSRYAFLNANCGGPTRAVILDLETGDWRTVGDPRDHFWPVRGADTYSVFALQEEDTWDGRGYWNRYYDATTGEEFKSGWSYMVLDEVERRLARPMPDDGTRLEVRDEDANGRVLSRWRRLVLVRDGKEEQVFPR